MGGFFVPFLNLVRPLQVMREVWHGSNPSGADDGSSGGMCLRTDGGTPGIIGCWWALFLALHVLGNIATRMALRPNIGLDQLQELIALVVLSNALDLPCALLALRLVERITRWQAERKERITEVARQQLQTVPPERRLAS